MPRTKDNLKREVASLLSKMTVREKASLLYGRRFWYVTGKETGQPLPEIMVTDGPSGLRKQCGKTDMIGLNESVPSIAYPTGSALASSWDPALLFSVGQALAEDCIKEEVSVLLGPAVNHKRDPLCGRNFEYYSEDPVLTADLGTAMVQGIQSKGVGACVKHFACNSQEDARFFSDSIVDERALREIYLRQFEAILRRAQPWMVMTAYNKLNGTHCTENSRLMTDIARREWGYEGLFVTDWSAMRDQLAAYRAGLDLEMPGTVGSDLDLEEAVKSGALSEEVLNERAGKVLELLLKSGQKKPALPKNMQAQHLAVARRAAEESAVLVKNQNILPFTAKQPILVIGAFAKQPRYQGGGSSKVIPVLLENALEELQKLGAEVVFAEGYARNSTEPDPSLIQEAASLAKKYPQTVVFAGLPESCETEGEDRTTLSLPASHNALIEAVLEANPEAAVVLTAGSPVTLPWESKAKAILLTYLAGCCGGSAAANILLGKVSPSGRLAETWPLSYEDTPAAAYYHKHEDYAEYRESIFTGYRFYDSAKRAVLFPFGHGLSYTTFSYSDLSLDGHVGKGKPLTLSFRLKNTGKCLGKETVQVYVQKKESRIFRPEKELKAYSKFTLGKGAEVRAVLTLPSESFAFYNAERGAWQTEPGVYFILVGASSRDIRLAAEVYVEGDGDVPDLRAVAPAYYDMPSAPRELPEDQFLALAKANKPKERDRTTITRYSPIKDLAFSKGGRPIYESIVKRASSNPDPEMAKTNLKMAMDMPVMNLFMGNSRRSEVDKILQIANGGTPEE